MALLEMVVSGEAIAVDLERDVVMPAVVVELEPLAVQAAAKVASAPAIVDVDAFLFHDSGNPDFDVAGVVVDGRGDAS